MSPENVHPLFTAMDASVLYVQEKVRQQVRREVTQRLVAEAEKEIQDAVDKALAEISFDMERETNPLRLRSDLQVIVKWAKAKERVKTYRTVATVEDVET